MPEQRQRNPEELGALWTKVINGRDCLTGTIDGQDVICFLVDSDNPNAPTWRVMKSRQQRDARGGGGRQREERPREERRYEGHEPARHAPPPRGYDPSYGGRGGYDPREPEHVRDEPYTRDDSPRWREDNRRGNAPARPAGPQRPRSDDV